MKLLWRYCSKVINMILEWSYYDTVVKLLLDCSKVIMILQWSYYYGTAAKLWYCSLDVLIFSLPNIKIITIIHRTISDKQRPQKKCRPDPEKFIDLLLILLEILYWESCHKIVSRKSLSTWISVYRFAPKVCTGNMRRRRETDLFMGKMIVKFCLVFSMDEGAAVA